MELENILADQNITLQVTVKAKQYLFDKGFDKKNGARPMAKVISSEIKVPISNLILDEKLKNGGHIKIDCDKDKICLEIIKNKNKKLLKFESNS